MSRLPLLLLVLVSACAAPPPVVGEHLELAVAGRPARPYTPVAADGGPLTIDLGSTGRLGVRPWTAATTS